MKYKNIHNLVRGREEDALNRFPDESADTKHDGKEENHQQCLLHMTHTKKRNQVGNHADEGPVEIKALRREADEPGNESKRGEPQENTSGDEEKKELVMEVRNEQNPHVRRYHHDREDHGSEVGGADALRWRDASSATMFIVTSQAHQYGKKRKHRPRITTASRMERNTLHAKESRVSGG